VKFSNLIKDTSFVKKSVNFMITFFWALATLSLTKKMKNLRLFLINLSLILARFYHSLRITEKPVFLNLQETRQDISSETVDVDSNTDLGERRRSVRAKRAKRQSYPYLEKGRGRGYWEEEEAETWSSGSEEGRYGGGRRTNSRRDTPG